jgi:hypothetical protein
MGKASSAKKVARAARAGGKAKGQRRNLGFPIAMVVLVLAGVGLVAVSRDSTTGDGSPALGEHWHAAYGIYICDRFVANLPNYPTPESDEVGIHSHDDGLIHIHPFVAGAAGDKATLGKFFDQVGVKVTDSSLTLPPGAVYKSRKYLEGETTCGGERARVVLAEWEDALKTDEDPEVRTSNIGDQKYDNDRAAYTIAFLPAGETIPPPPSASTILQGASADGGAGQPITGIPPENDLPPEALPPDTGSTEVPGGSVSIPPTEVPPGTDATEPAPTDAPTDTTGAEDGSSSG